jgi:two-component system CheB/CheR fusion protein
MNPAGKPSDNGGSDETQREAEPLARRASSGGEVPSCIVGIGASAGGLEALERLFELMPDDTGMAFVVVQHLSPDFRSLMGEVLGRWTEMPVLTVRDGMAVAANTIYLMPPRTEMIISDSRLLLTARERSDELRLPIDQFLRSLARDAGSKSAAIILSGTGSDGSRGICDVHAAGGFVLVQTPETAKFDGMPSSALETAQVDATSPPEEMPATLLRHLRHPRTPDAAEEEAGEMRPALRLLRERYGIDFANYKPTTVSRRTEHRMQLRKCGDLDSYLRLLREDRDELDALYRDLLIGVTNFFRDPQAYDKLQREVLPKLLERLRPGEEIRVWVAGCATGEEAYSIAMLLQEAFEERGEKVQAKVFATDVHERSLEHAAAGVYSEDAVAAIPPNLLHKHFHAVKDGYRVNAELRNMVVFAVHNVTKDAPFTRIDLISCRNLLIYLLPTAQTKALSLFHFGLKTGGVLWLGPSENTGELRREFDTVDQHWKMFRKHRDANLLSTLRLPMATGLSAPWTTTSARRDPGLSDVFNQVLEETLPPSVLLNGEHEVLHSFGQTTDYLHLPKGTPSLNIMEMLNDEMRLAVGAALHRATRDKKTVTLNNVAARHGENAARVNITVTPLAATRRWGAHFLVRFEEAQSLEQPTATSSDLGLEEAARDHISSLESELRFTKENLQATIEELETSNEELQATNEELLASNEELQSTNEELHSVNEELYTVNAEYQRKIEELTELTHDMDNLLASTDVHTIFLDDNLCIRRFTPKMAEVFHIIDSDIGRRIHGFMHSIQCADLPKKLGDVVSHGYQYEEEVKNADGASFLMRILPYKGDPNQGGVVMTLVDITGIKEAESRFRTAMEVSPNGMLMVCSRGMITQVNSELERIFGYTRDELIGQPLEKLVASDSSEHHKTLRQEYFRDPYVIRRMGGMPYVWGEHRDGRAIPLDVHVRPILTPHGRQAIASVVDVSQHQQLEASLREQVQQRDRFLATLSHELRNPMGAILSAASVLRTQAEKGSPEGQSQWLAPCDVIRRQASRMSRLLDDLLDVARVTQGKITLRIEVVDLNEICRTSAEAVRPMMQSHRHRFDLQLPEEPTWVRGDRVRLVQIVENLLTNAIKYTDDEGEIQLTLIRRDFRSFLVVRDNGRGMTPELMSTIFDMFVQSDETLDRREGGMGVGLTLVRSLVEMHEGKIEATSDGAGQGSQFTVQLPLSDPPQTSSPGAAVATPTNSSQTRVVLVEDDNDAREMMATLLQHHGHDVLATAADGAEGLEMITRLEPDAAILDIGLPKIDGYSLARQLRDRLGSRIYLIALTGYGRSEDRETVIEAGFNQHLVKPVNIKQLNEVLRRVPSE